MHQSREALNQRKLKVQSQEAKKNTETQPQAETKAETHRRNRCEYRDTGSRDDAETQPGSRDEYRHIVREV